MELTKSILLTDLINEKAYHECKLPMIMGVTENKDIRVIDLTSLPHLLVSGATKQGKTNFTKNLITSLIQTKSPDDLKLVLIDTKYTEFNDFRQYAQTYLNICPSQAINESNCIANSSESGEVALKSLIEEMKIRAKLLKMANVKNIADYNTRFDNGELPNLEHHHLPYIVCVCDDFSDLTNFSGKANGKNRKHLIHIAKNGHNVGIHLVIITQRPCPDVITWRLKRHFPSRISFRVTQKEDSKLILNVTGAENIRNAGDMIFLHSNEYEKIQTPYCDENVLLNKISKK